MLEPVKEFCLAVATAERVTSGAPVFFGRMRGVGDSDGPGFGAGVEMLWRELSGFDEAAELRSAVLDDLADFRSRAESSADPFGPIAVASVDVVLTLLDESLSETEQLDRILAIARLIAERMDGLGVPAPNGHESWVAYEVRSQADLDALVPGEVTADSVQAWRRESGTQGLAYWRTGARRAPGRGPACLEFARSGVGTVSTAPYVTTSQQPARQDRNADADCLECGRSNCRTWDPDETRRGPRHV